MMKHTIEVQNIKCGGCAKSIINKLSSQNNVQQVEVDIEHQSVIVSGENIDIEAMEAQLRSMGYPKIGEGNLLTTATSYVSCMIGRMSE